jgi:hypothetical protein
VRYGIVAAVGMGILLAIELRRAGSDGSQNGEHHSTVLLFGFLRGVVLGLAGMTIAGPMFGTVFGLLSGAGLAAVYFLGFAPTHEYETQAKPHLSRHKILASFLRALAVGAAGVVASLLTSPAAHWVFFGLKLGLAAGTVSALVGLFSPVIEWRIENFPRGDSVCWDWV